MTWYFTITFCLYLSSCQCLQICYRQKTLFCYELKFILLFITIIFDYCWCVTKSAMRAARFTKSCMYYGLFFDKFYAFCDNSVSIINHERYSSIYMLWILTVRINVLSGECWKGFHNLLSERTCFFRRLWWEYTRAN